ncbi:MAG: carbohydrate kinase family protein [Candidatus Pacearchaeota archaeon]
MKKFDVICFGSGLIDIFVYTDVHEKKKQLSYPIGSKIQINEMDFDVGGGGVNTSTTFSRFGFKTGFLGDIGEGGLSQKILDKIKKEKVEFMGERRGSAGYSVVLDSKEHDRTILTFKGGNDKFKVKNINFNSEWFYFSAMNGESFKSQLKIAESGKYKIAYNPSLYLFDKVNVKKIVKRCDIIILNKEEADRLDKINSQIIEMGPKIVIVTDGKNPFYCYTKSVRYKIYPNKDVKPVERTGAGDAFASGFVGAYIKTNDIEKSIRIGVANSESVIKYKGSTNKILTWEEAKKSIEKNSCKIESVNIR